jgi:hypothetical protein
VLDSGCTNHITGEKKYSHTLRRTSQQIIASHLEIIAKTKFLAMAKLLSLLNILFVKLFLLNFWIIIFCSFHNFVR